MGMAIRPSDRGCGATVTGVDLSKELEEMPSTLRARIEGMKQGAASDLLLELHQWQTRQQVQYRHKWSSNLLVMWDNHSVLHRATSGYEGYDRLLHRTTIGSQT